jgi:hypothetical protein
LLVVRCSTVPVYLQYCPTAPRVSQKLFTTTHLRQGPTDCVSVCVLRASAFLYSDPAKKNLRRFLHMLAAAMKKNCVAPGTRLQQIHHHPRRQFFLSSRTLYPLAAALLLSSPSSSSLTLSGSNSPHQCRPSSFVRRSASLLTSRRNLDLRGGGASKSFLLSSTKLQSTTAATTAADTEQQQQQHQKAHASVADSNDGHIRSSMTPSERLSSLRQRMAELDLDVYVVPSDDPHLSGTFWR